MLLRAPYLPYGRDIWCTNKGKVLGIEWADDGRVGLVSYKPGDWERDLLTVDMLSVARPC
jgi:hypothetical protein